MASATIRIGENEYTINEHMEWTGPALLLDAIRDTYGPTWRPEETLTYIPYDYAAAAIEAANDLGGEVVRIVEVEDGLPPDTVY